jgi:hypothetical protein
MRLDGENVSRGPCGQRHDGTVLAHVGACVDGPFARVEQPRDRFGHNLVEDAEVHDVAPDAAVLVHGDGQAPGQSHRVVADKTPAPEASNHLVRPEQGFRPVQRAPHATGTASNRAHAAASL